MTLGTPAGNLKEEKMILGPSIISSGADYRMVAKQRLPRFLFDYIDGGSFREETLAQNVADLSRLHLRQRVLRDVSAISLATQWFGESHALPVALGPVGLTGLYARRGEVQAARAARNKKLPFCLSTVSICDIDEVVQAAGPIWFQLYVLKDRAVMRDLVATAKAQGCSALIFTVDMPVPGARYRDAHSGLSGPVASLRRALQIMGKRSWAWDVGIRGRPHRLGNLASTVGASSGLADFMGWISANFDPSIRWQDLEWLRSAWSGPLIIKGVLDVDDALAAAALGADGIVVSNHGGRQLDGTISTARALSAIANAVGDRLTVLVDSGVRSGVDVVRMLALGARGVLLGRAWIYALAARGQAGVERFLEIIEHEMRVAMALTGCTRIEQINRSVLAQECFRDLTDPEVRRSEELCL